ncbi:MAG: hypothetical protein V3R16_09585 [Nitrospirales bacterium]
MRAATRITYLVQVVDRDAWERLCCLGTSIWGTWDPRLSTGVVRFRTKREAEEARREIT